MKIKRVLCVLNVIPKLYCISPNRLMDVKKKKGGRLMRMYYLSLTRLLTVTKQHYNNIKITS